MSDSSLPPKDKGRQYQWKQSPVLQQIADLTPDFVFVIDIIDLQLIYVNKKAEQVFGYAASYVYENSHEIFKKVLHPDDQQRRIEHLMDCKTLPDHLEKEVEVRYKTSDGNWRWFRIRDKVFKRDAEGTVTQTIGIAQDIHEQKNTEEKLKEEGRRLKEAQAIGHIGSFERSVPGEEVICSEEFLRIHGLDLRTEKLSTSQFLSLLHPDDLDQFLEAIHHTHATGEPLNLVNRIVRPDGSVRYVHRRSDIIKNSHGTPIRVYGTIQDVTELKQSEQTVRQMLNGSIAAICLFEAVRNEDGKITDFIYRRGNKAAEEILKKPNNEMHGRSLLKLWPGAKQNLFHQYAEVVESGRPLQLKSYYPFDNFNNWFDISAIKNGNGFILTLNDITAQKKAEEEVIKVKDELAKRATEKYLTLFNSINDGFCILEVIFNDEQNAADCRYMDTNIVFEQITGLENARGRTIRELRPDLEPYWLKNLGNVALSGKPGRFEDFLPFSGKWIAVNAFRIGNPEDRHVAVLLSDITERKVAEKQIRQQNAVLQGINRIFREALTSQSEEELGQVCLNTVEEMTGSTISFMGEINTETGKIEDIAISDRAWKEFGVDYSRPEKLLPAGLMIHGIYGKVITDSKGFYTNNPPSHPESIGTPKGHPKLNSFLGVPLIQSGKTIGMIGLANREGGYSREELEMTEALAPAIVQSFMRKRTEEALRKSEEQFRAIADLIPDLLWRNDSRGATDWCNRQWLEYTGQSYEEAIGYSWLNAVHPEDRDRTMKAFKTALAAGEPLRAEYRLRRQDGVYRSFLLHTRPMKNSDGKIARWYGSATDIHEEQIALGTLRQSEEQFRFMANSIPQIVWITDAVGRVEFTNQVFFNYTGATKSPSDTKEMAELYVHPEDVSPTLKKLKKARENKENFIVEHRIKSGSGEYRWFLVRATPYYDADSGKIKSWFGTSTDIQENKMAREALFQAKEEAEKAAGAKEEFLSTMSHEIRTPLNAVVGFTHLLLKQNPREDQKESLNGLRYASRNLMSLINDILDFSKIEAGKVDLKEDEFDLLDLMISLKQSHLPGAQEKGTILKLSIDDEIPETIISDQLKLSQILHNLVGNAVKFTRKGQVHLDVKHGKKHGKTLWLDFSVKDTGIGIAEGKIQQIFEKFSQADSSTMRHYGGTGLGLTITKMLLELMGSEIKVESREGKGSRFYFRLPVKAGTGTSANNDFAEEVGEEANPGQVKILLVEDVDLNRLIISNFLKIWWGIVPDEAINGKEAVERVRHNSYDLILMDVRMPEMDGYEATKIIRGFTGKENLPVIALTADTGHEIKQKPEAAFFTDVITKPFNPEDLRHIILKSLPGNREKKTPPEKENASGDWKQPDFREVEKKMDEDPESIIYFYKLSCKNLQEYKSVFMEAIVNGKLQQFSDMKHKATILLDTYKFDDLKFFLQETRNLMEEKEKINQLQMAQEKGNNLFDQKIKVIQARLEDWISRGS